MRNAKEAAALTELAAKMTIPTYNAQFEGFRHRLRDLVEKNFGYNAAKTLQYDDTAPGAFFWEESEMVGHAEGMGMRIDLHVKFDPRKPLPEEFRRIEAQYVMFRAKRAELCRLIATAGFEQ
jgi:hypothetical protein